MKLCQKLVVIKLVGGQGGQEESPSIAVCSLTVTRDHVALHPNIPVVNKVKVRITPAHIPAMYLVC